MESKAGLSIPAAKTGRLLTTLQTSSQTEMEAQAEPAGSAAPTSKAPNPS